GAGSGRLSSGAGSDRAVVSAISGLASVSGFEGETGGDWKNGNSVSAGSGGLSGFATASPLAFSLVLRLAMATSPIGCSPIGNHVRLPIGYQSGPHCRAIEAGPFLYRQTAVRCPGFQGHGRTRPNVLNDFSCREPAQTGSRAVILTSRQA